VVAYAAMVVHFTSMKGTIERILDALNQEGVRYLVVGGVAVVLHGFLRTTRDLDLVIQLDAANLRKGLQALKGLGYQPVVPVPLDAFADPVTRESWVREKNMVVFSLWHPDRPGFQIDLFAEEPFGFSEVYARALRVPLDRTEATVISLQDLIVLKRQAGRSQDLADIEALERLEKGQS
jgi:predicted nucleotidyltransferase